MVLLRRLLVFETHPTLCQRSHPLLHIGLLVCNTEHVPHNVAAFQQLRLQTFHPYVWRTRNAWCPYGL